MDHHVSRRNVLCTIGAGVVGTGFAVSTSAQSEPRLFVHPDQEEGADENDIIDVVEEEDGTIQFTYDNFPFVAASVPQNHIQELEEDRRVRKTEREGRVQLDDTHDPRRGPPCANHFDELIPWGYERIGAATANEEVTGQSVNVGIIDSGIQADHCDLEDAIASGINCTGRGRPGGDGQQGHGTNSAGVVGARNNDIGVVGIAPESRLHAVKAFHTHTTTDSEILCGIDWCITNDIEILSMSFGGEADTEAADIALETAYERGHLLVASAGNDYNNRDGDCEENNVNEWPAGHPDVIAVSAMDKPGTSRYEVSPLAFFSSVGPEVELMAPGVRTETTDKTNQYMYYSGTSAACPHVSGAAALGWEKLGSPGPDVGTRDRVREALQETAEEVIGTCEEGHGLVRADRLVEEL